MRTGGMSLNDISLRLKKPKSTIFYWIKKIKLHDKTQRDSANQQKATKKHAINCERRRKESYKLGLHEAESILENKKIRDFTMLYMCEGYNKSQNQVGVINTDPQIVKLAHDIIEKFRNQKNKIHFVLHIYDDHDEDLIREFWSKIFGISKEELVISMTKNRKNLAGRNWANAHGIATVSANDTMLRSRIQGWIDYVKKSWILAP